MPNVSNYEKKIEGSDRETQGVIGEANVEDGQGKLPGGGYICAEL